MNSCSFIVKIISTPVQRKISDDISIVESQVILGKLRKKKSFNKLQIVIWGNLGDKILKYYRKGDYIIIKGNLNLKPSSTSKSTYQKTPFFTVKKVYPFLLAE